MVVIKRSRKASASELVSALTVLMPYLRDQGEEEACVDLEKASATLSKSEIGSGDYKEAIAIIIDAFEGDHELMPYAMPRDSKGKWTEVEELCAASSKVYNLASRLK